MSQMKQRLHVLKSDLVEFTIWSTTHLVEFCMECIFTGTKKSCNSVKGPCQTIKETVAVHYKNMTSLLPNASLCWKNLQKYFISNLSQCCWSKVTDKHPYVCMNVINHNILYFTHYNNEHSTPVTSSLALYNITDNECTQQCINGVNV